MARKNLISFWAYIQKYIVTIPIIQRDYAQGRKGKEYLRQNFLSSMKYALDNPEQSLVLDFVYGGLQGNRVSPLDGQQRLTTLWLLHWYIAYKAGELGSASETLKRFHYETRISSDEFIQRICELEPTSDPISLKSYIKNQRWYRTTWDSDPTIKAMLTMIQGTTVRDRNGEDIIDGLEEIFANCTTLDFERYWKTLTSGMPIAFYEYALGDEDLPETDALYIKMNARGKPLSDFENFKADLFNFLKTKSGCTEEDVSSIGAWFDNAGTDLFWEQTNKDANSFIIDEVFFVFLKRYFLKKLIDNTPSDSIDAVTNRKAFKHLFIGNDNQQETVYRDFSPFEDLGSPFLSKDTFSSLQSLSLALRKIGRINMICVNSWDKSDNAYIIPQYVEKGGAKVSSLTIRGRLVFSSVIDYLEYNPEPLSESSFKDWIRFVWNIIEGTDTSGVNNLVQVSRFLHELANYSASIIKHLAGINYQDGDRDSELSRQFKEEIDKAKYIQELRERQDIVSENRVYEAERSCFFRGCIRFLYTTNDGSVDWNSFPIKLDNSFKLFDSRGVVSQYRTDSLLLCYFISVQTRWVQIKDIVFSNEGEEWRVLLKRKRYQESVHRILMDPTIVEPVDVNYESSLIECEPGFEEVNRNVQKDLCNHELMNNIVGAMDSNGRLHWRYDHYCVYPPNARADWKKYMLAYPRNAILCKLIADKTISSDTERRIGKSGFLWGWDVFFDYKGKSYCWDAWGNLKYYGEKRDPVKITATDVTSFINLLES